jgi:hypothetical protein
MTDVATPSRAAWLLEPSVDFARDVRGSAWMLARTLAYRDDA